MTVAAVTVGLLIAYGAMRALQRGVRALQRVAVAVEKQNDAFGLGDEVDATEPIEEEEERS